MKKKELSKKYKFKLKNRLANGTIFVGRVSGILAITRAFGDYILKNSVSFLIKNTILRE